MTYTPTAWVDYTIPCINAANLNNMENGIDRAQGDVMVLRGLTVARPPSDATLIGRIYFATDAPYEISRDNGAGWDVVGYTNNLFAALGTLQVGSGVGAAAPLGIGAPGEVLTVAAGTAAWAAPTGGAWNLIAETILAAPAATVTFAAIAGTYRALVPYYIARGDGTTDNDFVLLRCNGDGGANYSYEYGASTGTFIGGAVAAANSIWFGQLTDAQSADANIFSVGHGLLYDYASTTLYKHILTESWGARDYDVDPSRWQRWFGWGMWLNAATAITSITYLPSVSTNFIAGSRFTLYGIT